MGRTLHFNVSRIKPGNFTTKECEVMHKVSQMANIKPELWTCENFWLDPYDYYPNWKDRGGKADSHEQINELYARYESEGHSHSAICKRLYAEKYIVWANSDFTKCRSFTKTQGNELNSLMVFTCLIAISQQCPNLRITLHDEGEFLYCDLIIRQGRVIPNLGTLKENIDSWASTSYLTSQTQGMREVRKKHLKDADKDFLKEFSLDGSYGSCAKQYLDESIGKAKFVWHLVKECWTARRTMICEHNMNYLDVKNWFEPNVWHRAVDMEKFKDYKMSAATMMDGFEGEGFGLAEDAEGKSYRQIGMIQKMLGSDMDIKILGVDDTSIKAITNQTKKEVKK